MRHKRCAVRQCHAQVSAEEGEPPYYLIEYTVESSRGRKVYVCKYCIFNKRLYVLQAQAKQDTFDAKDEAGASVRETLRAATTTERRGCRLACRSLRAGRR